MVHPSSSPSCNGGAGAHSSTTTSKALSPIISGTSAQPQNHQSAAHHVTWSTPLAHTRVIPARESHGANPPLATVDVTHHSLQHDAGTIVGHMEGLNLTSATSSVSNDVSQACMPLLQSSATLRSQPTGVVQAIHQGSMPSNPNLRFLVLRRLQQGRGPPDTIRSDTIDERPAATEPQNQSEAVHKEPLGGTASISMNGAIITPPLATTTMKKDTIDLSLESSDEEQQKEPKNQKQKQKPKNTQHPSPLINVVNTAKRRVGSESSDTSEEGLRKRRKLKDGAVTSATNLPRFDSGSATSDTDHVRVSSSSSVEQAPSSRFSSSSIEISDVVVRDGPESIADIYNSRAADSSVARHDKPPKKPKTRVSVSVSVPVRTHKRPGGATVATSSRVEDMEEDEVETRKRTQNHASAISRKVRSWAAKLNGILTADLDSLFDDEIVPMSGREILEMLKEIDEDKNWATRAEVEDSHLEQSLIAVVEGNHIWSGTEAHKLAIRILDNFAQRFHGQRYPSRR
ncbi:hypothetical protein DFH29DRAFT_505718 [Suillus ampliporus]|nr:hypothetical protein DFH29DRAFT_505718 [Suillus ampliporus]